MIKNSKHVDDCSRNRSNNEGTLFNRDLHETPIEAVKKATSLKQTGSSALPMVNEAHQMSWNSKKFTDSASQMPIKRESSSFSKAEILKENHQYFLNRKLLLNKGAVAHDKCPNLNGFSHDLNELMIEFLLTHFTLYEMYVLFFQYQFYLGLEKDVIHEAKRSAIMSIDSENLSPRQTKRLKKIVWDMSPVMFGLMLNYIMHSSLFFDVEREDVIRPEFKLSR